MPYVEVYPFRFRADNIEYLLIKRSSADRSYPGTWQIVTGKRDVGESAVRAAVRELFEETGLRPRRLWSVPHVGSFHDPRTDAVPILGLFAAQLGDEWMPKLSEEHTDFQWLNYQQGLALLVWPEQRESLAIVHQEIVGGGVASKWTRLDPAMYT